MTTPTTEAGKRMLTDASCFAGFGEDGMAAAIAAIEAEARNAGYEAGRFSVTADGTIDAHMDVAVNAALDKVTESIRRSDWRSSTILDLIDKERRPKP